MLQEFIRSFIYGEILPQEDVLTIDHILPKSKGGDTTEDNLVTSCQSCNFRKADLLLKDATLQLNDIPVKKSPPETFIKAPQAFASTTKTEADLERLGTEADIKTLQKALAVRTEAVVWTPSEPVDALQGPERDILDLPSPLRPHAGLPEVRYVRELRPEEELRRTPVRALRPRRFLWLRIAIRRAKLKRRMRRMQWIRLDAPAWVLTNSRHTLRGRDGRFTRATIR